MTDLTKFTNAGVPADPKAYAERLRQQREAAPKVGTGILYMKVSQDDGLLTFGQDADEVAMGEDVWAINPQSMQHGWLLRAGARVDGEFYSPVDEPPPDDLPQPERGQEFHFAYRGQLVCIEGPNTGANCEFGGSAGAYKKFWQAISEAIEVQLLSGEVERLIPLVVFTEGTSYYSKKQGKDIYEVAHELTDFVSGEELGERAAASKKPKAKAKAPAAKKKAAPKRKAPARKR